MKENIIKTKATLNKMFDMIHESGVDGAYLTAEILYEYFFQLSKQGYCTIENDIHRCVREWRNMNDPTTPKTFEKYLLLASIFNCDYKDIVFLETDTDDRNSGAFDFNFSFEEKIEKDCINIKVNLPRIREKMYNGREMFVVDEQARANISQVVHRKVTFDGFSLLDKAIGYIKRNQFDKVASDVMKKLENVIFVWKNRRQPPSIEKLIMFEEITGIKALDMYKPSEQEITIKIPYKKNNRSNLNLFKNLKTTDFEKDRIRLFIQEQDFIIISIKQDCVIIKKNGKYGAIVVSDIPYFLQPKYDYLVVNNENIVIILNGKVAIFNKSDCQHYEVLKQSTVYNAKSIQNDYIRVSNIEALAYGNYRYYEIEGGIIVSENNGNSYFAQLEENSHGKVIKAFNHGKIKYGLMINKNLIIPPIYDQQIKIGEDSFTVCQNSKFAFLNHKGEQIIPFTYDNASSFYEGLVAVSLDGKYGYINKLNEIIIPFIYDYAADFHEGLAVVSLDGKDGYINKRGELIIPHIFDSAYRFNEGIAAVEKDGKYGYINYKGEEILPFIYDAASTCVNGEVKVLSRENLITKRINFQGVN